MTTRADMDAQNLKPAEVKARMSEMVGRVAKGQRRDRIEGFRMALRAIRDNCTCGSCDRVAAIARKHWGEAFDA